MKKEKFAYRRFVKQVHSLEIRSGSDEQDEALIIALFQCYHRCCFSFLQIRIRLYETLCGVHMVVLVAEEKIAAA